MVISMIGARTCSCTPGTSSATRTRRPRPSSRPRCGTRPSSSRPGTTTGCSRARTASAPATARERPADRLSGVGHAARSKILEIFGGLVLGCIKTKFCKKICAWQHFSRSTRFASFYTAAISKFSQKIGLKNQQFLENSALISAKILQMSQNLQIFAKFQNFQLENLVDFEKC